MTFFFLHIIMTGPIIWSGTNGANVQFDLPICGPSGTTSPLGGAQLVKKFANLILLPGQVTRSLNCPSPLAKNFQQYSNVSRPVKFAQNCKGDVHSPEHELCTSDKKKYIYK